MKTQLYSFHRSGTHYMCSLLKSRFFMDRNTDGMMPKYLDSVTGGEITGEPGRIFPATPMPFSGWGNEKGRTCAWRKIFGGHISRPTEKLLAQKKPIYLVRDGRDVMVSLWRLRNRIRDDTVTFKDYFFNFYPGHERPYVFPEGTPIAGFWWWSTLSWWKHKHRVLIIQYEDLLASKEWELGKVGRYLGRSTGKPRPNEDRLIGLAPNDGNHVGRWKEHFTTTMADHWDNCRCIAMELVDSGDMTWPA